jgi:predicted nucleic acid-binding protein
MKADAFSVLVLDASITLSWCFPDEGSGYAQGILDMLGNGTSALVPAIWPFEIANGLLAGERRKRLSLAQVTSVLERIGVLPISVEPVRTDLAFVQVLAVARQHQLSEYDAAYLELALRQALPLATLDESLQRAARTAGVALVTK